MITIRTYSNLDHDDVWRIHLLAVCEAGVEPTHQHYHDIFNIDELYLKAGGDFIVGAGPDGTVVAMGGLKKLSSEAAEVKRLRVHPSFQKRGYGKRVLDRLEQRAAELGFKRLQLDTLTNQYGAQKLFEDNGYSKKGQTIIDGFDVFLYEKSLS